MYTSGILDIMASAMAPTCHVYANVSFPQSRVCAASEDQFEDETNQTF